MSLIKEIDEDIRKAEFDIMTYEAEIRNRKCYIDALKQYKELILKYKVGRKDEK